jgi:hypothetical protein
MAIWQDLVDGHGFGEKYTSVKRFVRKLRGSSTPEARVVIETAPGEEAQVDYGTGPMVRDAKRTGLSVKSFRRDGGRPGQLDVPERWRSAGLEGSVLRSYWGSLTKIRISWQAGRFSHRSRSATMSQLWNSRW